MKTNNNSGYEAPLRNLEQSRKLKPEIPVTGIGGVPIRDEIEMEMFI